ncbi:MAG: TusE/DsrC/DsvC family sulfur relay protein [Pseudomonadota bacterium]
MSFECQGKTIETVANGYLADINDWNEDVAKELARQEGLDLTPAHWDLVHFLRDAYVNDNGHQPNDREINKFLAEKWGRKVSSKDAYDLFPGKPSKQAGKIAGLPETLRKGGY